MLFNWLSMAYSSLGDHQGMEAAIRENYRANCVGPCPPRFRPKRVVDHAECKNIAAAGTPAAACVRTDLTAQML